MKTIDAVISTLKNGDMFYVGATEYLFVGKTKSKGIESCVGCNQETGMFVGFPLCQSVRIPRPKPVRTNFWYKKKFLTLVCRHIETDRVEVRFSNLCSLLSRAINKGEWGIINELGGKCSSDDYIISVDYKCWKGGITIMLINTATGKSVAVRHINPEKVTTDNVQLILFELYKKYMNQ